jgi:hypothetical protein
MTKNLIKRALLLFVLLNICFLAYSQMEESTKEASHFNGAVTLTNNGISFIPNFTLGKPAAIFDLSMGKGKLSFEPQFRFALEGKPWSFVFWWRYKLLQSEKLKINIGAHPAIAFKTMTFTSDTVSKDAIVAQRYLAVELAPNYFFTKDISLGVYCFYAYGVEKDVVKNTEMFSLRSNFSNIRLSKEFFIWFNPQVYYLRMDEKDGYYFSASLTLAKRSLPISISALINKTIQTSISASKDFIWNASLIYSFNNKYTKAQ